MSAQAAKSNASLTSYMLLVVWAILSVILLSAVVVDEAGIMPSFGTPQFDHVMEHSQTVEQSLHFS
ncbi:hypothetical protein BTA51_18095 [Hahella sp. CCB-MM4]|uniref:hypothetical protein n=1 Tax=Hahella sp. (strain CCB-MM4) TaxID=1926491 RepID=UPI000B9BD1F1|nr:hypothetical protein [Hahella sp. CCB-MM4]OZG71918.1 hypothetical protein BTA51_18095 [Hahella sp. CCB-MM4]